MPTYLLFGLVLIPGGRGGDHVHHGRQQHDATIDLAEMRGRVMGLYMLVFLGGTRRRPAGRLAGRRCSAAGAVRGRWCDLGVGRRGVRAGAASSTLAC